MTSDEINALRERISIVQVIGAHTSLREESVNHVGLCPFCEGEGFTVNASHRFYYCFGCQKSGDVFRFVMDLNGASFVEAAVSLILREAEKHAKASAAEKAKWVLIATPFLRAIDDTTLRAEVVDQFAETLGIGLPVP